MAATGGPDDEIPILRDVDDDRDDDDDDDYTRPRFGDTTYTPSGCLAKKVEKQSIYMTSTSRDPATSYIATTSELQSRLANLQKDSVYEDEIAVISSDIKEDPGGIFI